MGWAYLDLEEETTISYIKVYLLSAWGFLQVIVQVSADALFAENVTTVFSSTVSLTIDGTTVYSGGKVGCTAETMEAAGWNGVEHVNSYQEKGNVFDAGNVRARYVRLTNTNVGDGSADANTSFTEIEVYGVGQD